MQFDAATPLTTTLDLLRQADALAVATTAAIEAGDDEAVLSLLDTRGTVIASAIEACGALLRTPHTADEMVQVTEAARRTVAIGVQARAAAIVARAQALDALDAMDAIDAGTRTADDPPHAPLPNGRIDLLL